MPLQFTNNTIQIFTVLTFGVFGIGVFYKIIYPYCITKTKPLSSKKDDDINPFYFDPGDDDLGPILI